MNILSLIKNKAQQALQSAGNFIDRDKTMGGVQLAQGGLMNRIKNTPFTDAQGVPTTVGQRAGEVYQRFKDDSDRYNVFSSGRNMNTGLDFIDKPIRAASNTVPLKFMESRVLDPLLNVPRNVETAFDKTKGKLQRGASALSAAAAFIPGIDDAVVATIQAMQERATGGNKDVLSTQYEPTPLGDILRSRGNDGFGATALDLAELPLMLGSVIATGKGADSLLKRGGDVLGNIRRADDLALNLPKRPANTLYTTPEGITFGVNKQPKTTQSLDNVLKQVDDAIKPADKTVIETTQKSLPSGDTPLGLPTGQRSVTIAQLKKLQESGSSLDGVTFVAKNADEARAAMKLGLPTKQIEMAPLKNNTQPLFGADGTVLKNLPENQQAFDFARQASGETLDVGNKFTRWVRKMFLDTEDNLKKTFGNSYKALEPAMETFKTRINDGLAWAKGYENRLVEMTSTVKPGSADDKLLRLFGKEGGSQKVVDAVGPERASQLSQTYAALRNMYDEMFDFINKQRSSAGLNPLPYKDDFLSQVGSSTKGMFDSFIEGVPKTVDAKSSAIFKKQGDQATTGAIESMRDYLEYAQRAGFTDLSGKEFADFAEYLSKQGGVAREAVDQLRTLSENITGSKEINPILKGIENVTGKLAGVKVLGKASTLVSQALSLPQAIGRDPIAFVSGLANTKAFSALRGQSRVLKVVSKSTPKALRTGNAFTKAVGFAGDVLIKGQDIANKLIFDGFIARAKKLGLDDIESVKWADEQLVKIVGDRRLGMSPQAYSTFMGKIFGRFTIEPTAATTRLVKDIGEKKFGSVLGTLVAWHIGNNINSKYGSGFEPFPDPYDAIKDSVEYWNGSDTKEQSKLKAVTRLISESLQTMPIIQNMFNTAYSVAELAGAPDSEEVFGQDDSTWMNSGNLYNPLNKWDRNITGNKVVDVPWNIAANVVPFAEQGARTTQAAATQARGYAETKNGTPMYKAPEGFDAVRSLLYGQSSTQNAKDFFNNDFSGWLTDNQKKAFEKLSREDKISFLENTQPKNENINRLRSSNKSVDSIVGGSSESMLSMPTSKLEADENKTVIKELLNGGQIPSKEDLSIGLFSGKTGDSASIQERTDVYEGLKTFMSSEYTTDEQKQALLDSAKVTKDNYDYYELAGKDQDVRLQEMLPKLDNMDNKALVTYLMQGRKAIAGKQLVSNTMVDYLYENDYISESEKKAIKAVKFDEIKNKFYISKSASGSGSMTYKQALALYKIDFPKFSTLKDTKSLLSNYSGGSQTGSSGEKLIEDILKGSPANKTNSNLWF